MPYSLFLFIFVILIDNFSKMPLLLRRNPFIEFCNNGAPAVVALVVMKPPVCNLHPPSLSHSLIHSLLKSLLAKLDFECEKDLIQLYYGFSLILTPPSSLNPNKDFI